MRRPSGRARRTWASSWGASRSRRWSRAPSRGTSPIGSAGGRSSSSGPPSSCWRRSATRSSGPSRALLVVRLFHGTGMGFGPTAATVIATDLTPLARRGAAMGLYGLASAVALAVGPYAGGSSCGALASGRRSSWRPRSRPSRSRSRGRCRRPDPAAGLARAASAARRTGARPAARSRGSGGAGSAPPRCTPRRSSWRSTSRTAASPRSCRSSRSGASWGTRGSSTRSTRW